MQLKPITAIAVLLLVVASLLVAGCTNTTLPSPSPTPTPVSLKAFVTAYHTRRGGNVTWINDTTVSARYRYENTGASTVLPPVVQFNDTIRSFSTIAEASEFVKTRCNGWRIPNPEYLSILEEFTIFNMSTGHGLSPSGWTGREPSVASYCNNTVTENNTDVGYSYFQLENIVIYSIVTPAIPRPALPELRRII